MNIFRLAFELFALYLLYKLIFDFIIPVYKTTKQVKKQFNQMSAQMRDKMNQQETQYSNTTVNTSKSKTEHDDYIEFEEVKK
jgi:hypothetical protein